MNTYNAHKLGAKRVRASTGCRACGSPSSKYTKTILLVAAVFGALMFFEKSAAADSELRPYTCIAENSRLLYPRGIAPGDAVANPYEQQVKQDIRSNCERHLTTSRSAARPIINEDDWIVVRFANPGSEKPAQLPSRLEVTVRDSSGAHLQTATLDDRMHRYEIAFQLTGIDDSRQGELLVVNIETDEVRYRARYVRVFRRWTAYGLASSSSAFWLPVGLLATSFERGDSGILLGALPVNAAIGHRLHFKRGWYLGGSLMGGWLLHQRQGADGGDAELSLSTMTVGALVDVNNYMFGGVGYSFDFRSGRDNPGFLLVFGAGPSVIQALKSRD